MKLITEKNMKRVKMTTVLLGLTGLAITAYIHQHEGASFHSAVAFGYYEAVKLCQEALEPLLRFLEVFTEGGAAAVRETAAAIESAGDAVEDIVA